MWQVRFDPSRCQTNALCVDLAPTVFAIDDEDALHILPIERGADDSTLEDVRRAVASCPVRALTIQGVDAG